MQTVAKLSDMQNFAYKRNILWIPLSLIRIWIREARANHRGPRSLLFEPRAWHKAYMLQRHWKKRNWRVKLMTLCWHCWLKNWQGPARWSKALRVPCFHSHHDLCSWKNHLDLFWIFVTHLRAKNGKLETSAVWISLLAFAQHRTCAESHREASEAVEKYPFPRMFKYTIVG